MRSKGCERKLLGGLSGYYPVNVNFPALIPCLGSLSLGDPNLTNCAPLSSENTLFKPSSNFWAKAERSSGVLNFDFFSFSGCRSVGKVTDKEDLNLPETASLALAVTNSPPCNKPCGSASTPEETTKDASTDNSVGIVPRLAGEPPQ